MEVFMDENQLLKLENQLCFKLYSVSRGITRVYKPLLDKLEITYPQYLVLLYLWENGASTLKKIGNSLYLDSGTLTPLLKRMEKSGLIIRNRADYDERELIITLTEKGFNIKQEAFCIPNEILCKTNLSFDKYLLLKDEIDKLLKTLFE